MSAIRRTIRSGESGFKLLELVAVLAVILIVMATGVPMMARVMSVYRARAAAVDVASLLQRARFSAIQNDTYYPVPYSGNMLFVDANYDGAYQSGEAVTILGSGAAFTTSPPVAIGTTQMGVAPNTAGGSNWVAFGARGTPCAISGNTCSTSVATTTTAYVYYIQVQYLSTSQYSAVTISQSGRIRVWTYDGTKWS